MGKRIEIIYDLEILQGTCYVEIKPGKFVSLDNMVERKSSWDHP